MGEYEDRITELRESGQDDLADYFEGFSASKLREAAGKSGELTKRNQELEEEISQLKRGPKLEEAFRSAGVDYEALKPAERREISRLDVKLEDLDEEFIGKVISELELPLVAGHQTGGEEGELTGSEQVVQAARRAPSGVAGRSTTPVLTVEDVADWSAETAIRFNKEHPAEAEALRRGESVTVAFTP